MAKAASQKIFTPHTGTVERRSVYHQRFKGFGPRPISCRVATLPSLLEFVEEQHAMARVPMHPPMPHHVELAGVFKARFAEPQALASELDGETDGVPLGVRVRLGDLVGVTLRVGETDGVPPGVRVRLGDLVRVTLRVGETDGVRVRLGDLV